MMGSTQSREEDEACPRPTATQNEGYDTPPRTAARLTGHPLSAMGAVTRTADAAGTAGQPSHKNAIPGRPGKRKAAGPPPAPASDLASARNKRFKTGRGKKSQVHLPNNKMPAAHLEDPVDFSDIKAWIAEQEENPQPLTDVQRKAIAELKASLVKKTPEPELGEIDWISLLGSKYLPDW